MVIVPIDPLSCIAPRRNNPTLDIRIQPGVGLVTCKLHPDLPKIENTVPAMHEHSMSTNAREQHFFEGIIEDSPTFNQQ
jgi:hypothetical protein